MGPRDVLNKLKWHPDFDLNEAEITIIHRGAPRDRLVIQGEDVIELGSGFMKVNRKDKEVKIPYHRIVKIVSGDKVVWSGKR